MATKTTDKTKMEKIDQFLNEEYVLLHIDPKRPNLTIPLHLRQGNTVILKISRYFRGAMELTDTGVVANLLFSGSYFTCIIPYAAIWGITNSKGENIFWPDCCPKEVLSDVFSEIEPELPVNPSSEKQPVKPATGLYCIESAPKKKRRTTKKEAVATESTDKKNSSKKGQATGLRLVK